MTSDATPNSNGGHHLYGDRTGGPRSEIVKGAGYRPRRCDERLPGAPASRITVMAGVIKQPCDEAVIWSKDARSPCAPKAEPWVLAATILGSGMAFLDGTAVTVALPAIQDALGATAVEVQWVSAAYALLLAALILAGGSLGDRLGRRRIFAAGVMLFALASASCGLAQNPEQLVLARAVQGLGGALLVPNSLAILGASFEEKRRGKAIGTWAALTGVAMVVGPIFGGYLAENLSWRGVFFINIPLALAILAITLSRVPESRDASARRLDPMGATLAAVGLGGVVFGLLESSRTRLDDPLVASSLVLGLVALAAFVFVEGRRDEPMLPLELFRSRDFSGANAFTLLFYFALGGTLFFLPFNLIQVQGYTAMAAGAAIVPAILLVCLLSRPVGALADRHGARLPLAVGSVIAAAGFAMFALPGVEGGSYWTSFFPATLVLGVGLAAQASSVTTVVLGSVEEGRSGLAAAINNAFSQAAGLFAVVVLGVLMLAVFGADLDSRLASLDLPPEARRQLAAEEAALAAAHAPEGLDFATAGAVERAIDEAFVTGYRVVMLVAAITSLAGALCAAFLIGGNEPKTGLGEPQARSGTDSVPVVLGRCAGGLGKGKSRVLNSLGTVMLTLLVVLWSPAHAAGADERFREEEIRFESGEITLRGTIVIPDGASSDRLPAVVLVHGSGPGPRDQMRREAEAFARQGTVALIYDKRTEGYSASGLGERSYGLLADDALAAVRALRRHPAVDPEAVGLWGMSEGGWVVPIAANRSDDVAFVVLVGASGVPPARQVSWYLENELRHQGVSGSMVGAVSRTGIRVQAGTGGMAEAHHDPAAPLEQLRQPVLAIWGEKDRVVPPAESARVFEDTLRNGENESYTIRFFPDAQHGLESSPDGFARGEMLAEGYPGTVASWIAAVAHSEAPPSSAAAPPRQQRLSRPLEPLSWWESGWVQVGAMAVPLLAFVSYPVVALGTTVARLVRGRPRESAGTMDPSTRRWARCVVGGGIAAMLGFVCYFGFLLFTAASSVGPVVVGRPVPWLVAQLLSVVACASVALLAASWRRVPKRLPVTQQVRLCVLVVGGVVFAVWAAYWGLLSP